MTPRRTIVVLAAVTAAACLGWRRTRRRGAPEGDGIPRRAGYRRPVAPPAPDRSVWDQLAERHGLSHPVDYATEMDRETFDRTIARERDAAALRHAWRAVSLPRPASPPYEPVSSLVGPALQRDVDEAAVRVRHLLEHPVCPVDPISTPHGH